MKIDGPNNRVRFDDTGRDEYAYAGVIGLSPNGTVHTGYDDEMYSDLSPAERKELADHMIAQWTKFRDAQ